MTSNEVTNAAAAATACSSCGTLNSCKLTRFRKIFKLKVPQKKQPNWKRGKEKKVCNCVFGVHVDYTCRTRRRGERVPAQFIVMSYTTTSGTHCLVYSPAQHQQTYFTLTIYDLIKMRHIRQTNAHQQSKTLHVK